MLPAVYLFVHDLLYKLIVNTKRKTSAGCVQICVSFLSGHTSSCLNLTSKHEFPHNFSFKEFCMMINDTATAYDIYEPTRPRLLSFRILWVYQVCQRLQSENFQFVELPIFVGPTFFINHRFLR